MINNHKNIFYLLIIFVSISFFLGVILYYSNDLIDFFLNENNHNYLYFISLLLFTFIYFLTPLPVTPIMILNGYLFGYLGFFLSYILIIIDSFLFLVLNKFTNFQISKKLLIDKFKKYKKILLYSNKIETVFITRFIIPPFFHNLYYSLTKIKTINFISSIILAEIPSVLAWNLFGKSLNTYIVDNLSLKEVLLNINFILPLLIVIIVLIFTKKFTSK